MADTEVQIIKIILPSEEQKKTPVAQSNSDSSTTSTSSTSSSSSGGSGALSAQDVIGAGKKIMAYTGIKQIAESYITYNLSTVDLRTGASEYSQKLQFAYNEGSQAYIAVGSIAMGAAVGGVVGAARNGAEPRKHFHRLCIYPRGRFGA